MTHAKHCPVCKSGQMPGRKRCTRCLRHACFKCSTKVSDGWACALCVGGGR